MLLPIMLTGHSCLFRALALEDTIYIYSSFENDPLGSYDFHSTPPKGFGFCDIGPGNVTIFDNSSSAHTGERYSHHYVPAPIPPEGGNAFANWLKRSYTDGRTMVGRSMPYEYPQLYVRWFVKFARLPAAWGDVVRLFYFFYFYENATSGFYNDYGNAGIVQLSYAGDNYTLSYLKLWGATGQSTEVALDTDKWHSFEVLYKRGSEGEWKLWFDGDLLFSVSGNVEPPGSADPNWLAYGVHGFDVGLYGAWDNSAPVSLLLDDVVMANYRVGLDWAPPEETSLTIQVFDNATKDQIPGARVSINSIEESTNESGLAIFSGIPTFSSIILTVLQAGYHSTTRTVDVREKDPNVTVFLKPAVPGFFEIQAYTGIFEVISEIEISTMEGMIVKTAETPCRIELTPGTYIIKAAHVEQSQNRSATVLEDETTKIVFQFEVVEEIQPFLTALALIVIVAISIVGGAFIHKRFRI